MRSLLSGFVGVGLLLSSALLSMADSWVAYNDMADTDPDNSPTNITSYGLGRSYVGDGMEGELINFGSGEGTGVSVELIENTSEGATINWAGDSADYAEGSDAYDSFGEVLNLTGNLSYNDAPGWSLDLVITGLDPSRTYTFVATANRNGGASYGERVTNWSLREAESFQYMSSPGAHKINDAMLEFSTGDNVAGNVARWTKIQAGADGQIVIRTSHSVGEANGGLPGAHAYKGYAGGVFSLALEEMEAAYHWIAYNDVADFNPDETPGNATNFGLGRGYDGAGSQGELTDFDTGLPLGITLTMTETVSEGETINWAGDPADFVEGTDAAQYFGGILQLTGNLSYNDAPGWYLDTTFSGLDPNEVYTYVGTANRNGGDSYGERVTNWSLIGAQRAVFASSEGTHKVSDTSVEFSTGNNVGGYVARWTDIRPAADGTFTIRTSHGIGEENGGMPGAHAYKGYASGLFLLLEQSASSNQPATPAIEVFRLQPLNGADKAHPNTPIQAILKHTRASVDPESVLLLLDGTAVTANITTNAEETRVFLPAASLYASGSTHEAVLQFSDAEGAEAFEQSWTFTVEDYADQANFPVIASDLGQPFESLTERTRGFAVRIGAPDAGGDVTVGSLEEAEAVWDQDFDNLADISDYNPSGYFIEGGSLNYQTDGAARGNKPGEQLFPGVESGDSPEATFAFEARSLWYLHPGFYTLNITVDTEFEIYLGPTGQEVKLPRTFLECNNCGGEDAPWIVNFIIEEAGLYPVRVVYFNEGGSGSLELLEVARDGGRHLVNSSHPNAIVSYVPPELLTDPLQLIAMNATADQWQLDFLSPDPNATHEVQSSLTLMPDSWAVEPNVAIESLDNGFLRAFVARDGLTERFYRIALLPPPPVFYDDMENGIGDWIAGIRIGATATSTAWELGVPVPSSGLVDGAFSGNQAWGTDLDDTYAPGALITLRSPVIDLTGVERPRLRFRYAIDSTEEVEGGRINFRDEAGDLLLESDFFFWGVSEGWQLLDSPVPVEARNRKIIVEFEFLSDGLGPNGEGWFIDDVSLGL